MLLARLPEPLPHPPKKERRARNARLASNETAFVRREPFAIQDQGGFSLDAFAVPHHYKDDVKEIMIPHGLVIDRIQKLAKDIRHDYADTTIHLLCVLKGGSAYFQDLVAALRRFHDYSDHVREKRTDGLILVQLLLLPGMFFLLFLCSFPGPPLLSFLSFVAWIRKGTEGEGQLSQPNYDETQAYLGSL